MSGLNASERPHVAPVGFCYDPDLGAIDVGGHDLGRSKKLGDAGETGRVAFVVDDVLIRIFPERIAGWGIGPDAGSVAQ